MYYWTPTIGKNGPKQHKKLFFCPKGKKSLGRSPPQELEVGPRSGPYLLVTLIIKKKSDNKIPGKIIFFKLNIFCSATKINEKFYQLNFPILGLRQSNLFQNPGGVSFKRDGRQMESDG